MIISQSPKTHVGKTIAEIRTEVFEPYDLTVADQVLILFTDGSRLLLKPDCRGECGAYISEHV